MEMAYNDRNQQVVIPSGLSTEVDFNTNVAEDTVLFAASQQIQIHKIGICLTTSQTGTSVVDFEKADSTGLDVAAIGTVNIPASSPGKFIFLENAGGKPLVTLKPGEFVTVDSTKTGVAPKGVIVIEWSYLDEALSDSNEVATL